MRKIGFKLALLSTLLLSVAAKAQVACGVVSTNVMTTNPNEYRVVITNGGKKTAALHKGVAVSPGKHEFSLIVVSKNRNAQYKQNEIAFSDYAQLSDEIYFELDVKADHVYRLVAKVVEPAVNPRYQKYEIVVAHQGEKPCEREEVLPRLTNIISLKPQALPEQLEYRLNLVMKDLQQFYRSSGVKQKQVNISRKPQIIDVLGVVLDQQFDSDKGLKVLAVTPASSAANIGLQPNDVIIRINQLDLIELGGRSTRQELAHALKLAINKVTLEKEAAVTLKRNGELIRLAIRYQDITLPGYQLQLQLE